MCSKMDRSLMQANIYTILISYEERTDSILTKRKLFITDSWPLFESWMVMDRSLMQVNNYTILIRNEERTVSILTMRKLFISHSWPWSELWIA